MPKKIKNFIILSILIFITGVSVYFILYKETFDIRDEAASTDEWGDERFGIGGAYYSKLADYKIKWVYNWGWDVAAGHLFTNGRKNMIMIGDPDYPRDGCGDSFNPENPGCGGYSRITDLATKYPSSYWSIDNEPDWQGYMTPDIYAKWFHTFSTAIRSNDPTAKISVGGIAWPRYNHPVKWAMKDLVNDPYIVSIKSSDTANKNIYENAAWVILFRKYYRDYYGVYPQVDFWNIHPYPWKTKVEDNLKIEQKAYNRFLDSKESILFFRNYMNFIGESEKPLWVTEFSWMSGNQCSDFKDCNDKSAGQNFYMKNMIEWLTSTNHVQKWFWYYGGEEASWAGTNYTADIFYKDGELNNVGKKYLEYANTYMDREKPQIDNLLIVQSNRVDKRTTVNLAVEASDNVGLTEYHYCVGSSEGNDDIKVWNFDATISTNHSISIQDIEFGDYKVYVNLKVKDGSNNESTVKSIKISDEYCQSDCTNKQCGDDGCGGSCGNCSRGYECSKEGICESTCTRDCSDKECGTDGCFGSCGFCTSQNVCIEGRCECLLNCMNKQCGDDDGCGERCTNCDDGLICNRSNWSCEAASCVPNCGTNECGDNGCGGSCGTCADSFVCLNGTCEQIDYTYDINIDGKVNMFDVAVISSNWKWKGEVRNDAADINEDGVVNMLDLAIVINNWTKKY